MRLAWAIAVVAVALSAAVYIHQGTVRIGSPEDVVFSKSHKAVASLPNIAAPAYRHPSWEDPVAVLLALGGVAVAVGIVRYRRN